jgi:pimeloyl-ACP methyl ester carboxylesterase
MKKKTFRFNKKPVIFKISAVFILILAAIITIYSCKKKKSDSDCTPLATGGLTMLSHTDRTAQDVLNQIQTLPDDSSYYDYNDFYRETLTEIPGTVQLKPIAHEVVKYTSTDDNGNQIQLTGLLIYPWNLKPFGKVNAPIISVNHGTQILKSLAPSKWKSASVMDWKNFPEMVIADIMACYYNWIIIMPDYQGMGDDISENHPYCVRDRLANATADMVEAAQNSLSCDRNDWVRWNGKTYLYGYSEGGFVTMAAARELEARNVSLAGVVCMDGPYDLTGAMLPLMLSNDPFPVPYFLPMMLTGYNSVYPDNFQYAAMLKEPYKTNLPAFTTGFYDETVVNSKMPADKILKEVFTDSFYDSLNNQNSQAYKILYENNSYVDWTPKSKMLIWHCINDDCVPFTNFTSARTRFTGLGLSNIDYVVWPAVTVDPKKATVHVTVAPRAFYEGANWIYHHL